MRSIAPFLLALLLFNEACAPLATLPVLATLPKLKRLGLHESFLTYDGRLKHLKPLA